MDKALPRSIEIEEIRGLLEQVSLSESEWGTVLNFLPSALYAYGPAAGYSMVRMLSKKLKRTTSDTNSALSLVFKLASLVLTSEKDMPSMGFSETEKERISNEFPNTIVPKILNEIATRIDDLDELHLRNFVASSILPTFQVMYSHINLRAITAADFAPTAIESMEDADIYGLVPTATIAIVTDESKRKPLIFQAGRLGVVAMIDQLKVILRRIDSTKNILEGDGRESDERLEKGGVE